MNEEELIKYMDSLLDELLDNPLCEPEEYDVAKKIVRKIRGKLNNVEK